MRMRGAASAALLGAATLTLTPLPASGARPAVAPPDAAPPPDASTGHSHSRFQASVIPRAVTAGRRVTLSATGCAGTTTVSSGAFDPLIIGARAAPATAAVAPHAATGTTYQVVFACTDGAVRTIGLTVASGHHEAAGTPRHGVQAGVGGSLDTFDLQEIMVGVALLAGALGLAYRRSRRPPADQEPATPATPATSPVAPAAPAAPAEPTSSPSAD